MGKKRLRKKLASSGSRKNVAAKLNLWSMVERELFKVKARRLGKRVCETIPNPDKTNTKERFIRVCTGG